MLRPDTVQVTGRIWAWDMALAMGVMAQEWVTTAMVAVMADMEAMVDMDLTEEVTE